MSGARAVAAILATDLRQRLRTPRFWFLIAGLAWGWSVYYAPGPSARTGDATVVTLPSGSGVSAIAARLRRYGLKAS